MTTVRFQSEPEEPLVESGSTFVKNSVSDQSLSAALQAVVLTLCLKGEICAYDFSTLTRLIENDRNLMIVKNKQCLFPLDIKEEDFSLCLVLEDSDLNVCDLKGRHSLLAAEIENAWPSILTVANKVKELFIESDAALLINRTSGRILAASNGFSAISGLTDEECTGQEFGELGGLLSTYFSGKKVHIQNLAANELYLSIVSYSSVSQAGHIGGNTENPIKTADSHSYRLLNESHAIGLFASRFNALLESGLKNTLYPHPLARLERVISELTRYCSANGRCLRAGMDSPGVNACLRFLVQSIVMSHRNSAGESASTEIEIDYRENETVEVVFATPAGDDKKSKQLQDEWWELAESLAKRIDIQLSELQIKNKTIVNRIQVTLRPAKPIYAQ